MVEVGTSPVITPGKPVPSLPGPYFPFPDTPCYVRDTRIIEDVAYNPIAQITVDRCPTSRIIPGIEGALGGIVS
jgi:hypothetical protein